MIPGSTAAAVLQTSIRLSSWLQRTFPHDDVARVQSLLSNVSAQRLIDVGALRSVNPSMYVPGLSAEPFLDPSGWPLAAALSKHWTEVRRELTSVFDDDRLLLDGSVHSIETAPAQQSGNPLSGMWRSFYLHRAFRPVSSALARCPVTAAALTGHELSREAMFSLLGPGTHIGEHSDGVNSVVTLYLPLIVPSGSWIRFGPRREYWREGECLAADSTFLHESANPGPGWRGVLIVDLWHPELTTAERAALRVVLAALDDAISGLPTSVDLTTAGRGG